MCCTVLVNRQIVGGGATLTTCEGAATPVEGERRARRRATRGGDRARRLVRRADHLRSRAARPRWATRLLPSTPSSPRSPPVPPEPPSRGSASASAHRCRPASAERQPTPHRAPWAPAVSPSSRHASSHDPVTPTRPERRLLPAPSSPPRRPDRRATPRARPDTPRHSPASWPGRGGARRAARSSGAGQTRQESPGKRFGWRRAGRGPAAISWMLRKILSLPASCANRGTGYATSGKHRRRPSTARPTKQRQRDGRPTYQ